MKKTKKMIYRQGDVLITSCDDSAGRGDEVPRENGAVVLAHGEVTGHSHAIYGKGAKLFAFRASSDRFLDVTARGGARLRHEEHGEILLPPGGYRVRIQTEWSDEEAVNVAD